MQWGVYNTSESTINRNPRDKARTLGAKQWPTSLHLSKLGFEVLIIDNLSRRKIDTELGSNSLTPIQTIDKRIQAWEEVTKEKIELSITTPSVFLISTPYLFVSNSVLETCRPAS